MNFVAVEMTELQRMLFGKMALFEVYIHLYITGFQAGFLSTWKMYIHSVFSCHFGLHQLLRGCFCSFGSTYSVITML